MQGPCFALDLYRLNVFESNFSRGRHKLASTLSPNERTVAVSPKDFLLLDWHYPPLSLQAVKAANGRRSVLWRKNRSGCRSLKRRGGPSRTFVGFVEKRDYVQRLKHTFYRGNITVMTWIFSFMCSIQGEGRLVQKLTVRKLYLR